MCLGFSQRKTCSCFGIGVCAEEDVLVGEFRAGFTRDIPVGLHPVGIGKETRIVCPPELDQAASISG